MTYEEVMQKACLKAIENGYLVSPKFPPYKTRCCEYDSKGNLVMSFDKSVGFIFDSRFAEYFFGEKEYWKQLVHIAMIGDNTEKVAYLEKFL